MRSSDEQDRPIARYLSVFRYSRRAVELVWTTSRALTLCFAGLTVAAGLLPAAVAYVGKLIVDAVVHAAKTGTEAARWDALTFVAAEAGFVILLLAAQRGLSVCESLLRARLGQRVNEIILEKATTLELRQFEDSEFYDKMTRARRQASSRPLSLVRRTFGLVQNSISLITYGALLLQFSGWAAAILLAAGLPAFWVEAKFSEDAFRLFRWRSPETRRRSYLEMVLAREDHAKEVKLFQLAPMLLGRYRAIFAKLFGEDRALTLRRGFWGYLLGLLSTAAFYGAYGWIVVETIAGHITLGDMTMYLLVFKQGQSAVSSSLSAVAGMYEDNLYLSTLYEYLEQPTPSANGTATTGPRPDEGLQFEGIRFTYPGGERPAVDGISFDLCPGQRLALVGENGSGKTTLIKMLTRLYDPDEGRILLDGRDLRDWDVDALRRRVGVIFQDFVQYQLIVGENIGVGDVERIDDESGWKRAARKGMADPFIGDLPAGYQTQLGRWFNRGQELSGGQWQKVALSRVFMREEADILVLDEPTASMDAEAEFQVFERLRQMTDRQMAILISHRFSTVRMAEQIIVLDAGRVIERGDHDALVARDGTYARLFSLQAAGYR